MAGGAGPFWTAGRRTGAALALAVCAGGLLGLGGTTFLYAKGWSYLTDDPAACANCHGMQPYLDAWRKGSHRSVATCNDCHTPAGLVGKYAVKASNGFWHSFYFTTGNYPDNIRMRPSNEEVVDAACVKCHEGIAEQIRTHGSFPGGQACVRCHFQVGHAK
jgi:cytochrome c nitrite reductase small subunit